MKTAESAGAVFAVGCEGRDIVVRSGLYRRNKLRGTSVPRRQWS
jgi:hypothetical protein